MADNVSPPWPKPGDPGYSEFAVAWQEMKALASPIISRLVQRINKALESKSDG